MSSIQGLYYRFAIIQGETFGFSFDFSIENEAQYFDEYDFVGHVRDEQNAYMVIATMNFSENLYSSSVIDVAIASDKTQSIVPATYTYEIKATNKETGKVKTLFYGPFSVKNTMILGANAFGV